MESGWFLQAVLVLSWLSLFKAQNTPGPGVFCLRSIPADGHTLLTFLRHDAAGVRFLYLTKWSEDMRLAACEINSNPDVTEEYHAFCNIKETWDQELVEKFKIGVLLSPDSLCALVPSGVPESSGGSGKDETERKTRRKRSWIFPGTLWCGTGTKAAGFEQLGMFEKADKCCREHDHCSDIIPAFTVNYGVFNPNFFTVSHCGCDQRFRQCLLGTNDSISSVVGYSFFNILKVPCFELKQQKHCTQMYWWGMCKKAREAPYAIFKSPLPFNSSDVTGKYDNNNLTISKEQHLFERPVSNPEGKASESKHRCRLRDPSGGDMFHSRRTKGSECKRHTKLSGEGPSQMPRISMKMYSKTLKRDGKKKTGGKDVPGLAQKTDIPPTIPTTTSVQISSTAIPSSIPALTQRLILEKDFTKVKGVIKQVKSKHKAPYQSKCCESNMAVSRDIARLHCKSCLKPTVQKTQTKTYKDGSPVNLKRMRLKNKTGIPNQEPLTTIWSAATFATPITREQNMTASFHKKGNQQKQLDFNLLWKQAGQQPLGHITPLMIHANNSLVKNDMADNEVRCQSLKHLDDCKYKIPPFEKKYNLTNMESKTAYHCDCTSRLAVWIKGLKEPSPPHSLMVEFVSQDCFTLSKEKKCNRTKRCSGGFTEASDLHQALKKIKEKDSAAMRFSASGRKKRIPVRLYKYCLRLQMRADIMAQLK
ncbi:group 3 secretory phospholipase A2-like isoform X2 [Girardinichthys multiradiatus]|uniref:group 3 secretory phospholipase A2-like isoform X2 n=1 Tax=Girardinichthys multiradiatus TaxID=208333 RepID=UPI001FADD8BC|nr:group 3 secretory phospholipase A2-like isoform X2 [Girardinichthys multiradiatus]